MIGVLINFLTVVIGGAAGSLMRGKLNESLRVHINRGLALCVMLVGIKGAIETANMLLVILCIVIGTLLGVFLRIEDNVKKLGYFAEKKFSGGSGFAEGFVNATLLFCIGAMAVVGSLEAGLQNKADTLVAKAAIDGVSAIIFASMFGPGVILSAVPLTLYQGAIALFAGALGNVLTPEIITEMSATGSLLIIGLSLNMLELMDKPISVAGMLPSVFVPIAAVPLYNLLTSLF